MPATAQGAREAARAARAGNAPLRVASLAAGDAPIGEVGTPLPGGIIGAGTLVDNLLAEWEETAELRWPLSVAVYDRMARSDAQVDSVYRAVTLPIRRAAANLAGDDVRDEVKAFVEVNLGLDPDAANRARRRPRGVTGVNFRDLIRDALLMLRYGHSLFEQVYELRPPGPELGNAAPAIGRAAYLSKLALRPARTITGWRVARDGGLEGITQDVPGERGIPREVVIGIERLVAFVNDREGADWTGRSILRSSYKHWLIKDVLLRLGPQAIERNGMGVPTVYFPPDGDEQKALSIARAFRAGAEAGTALPEGYRLELVGVTGSVRDELPLVKYHDEAIGRAALAMFLNLGHDNGARSLGDTFVDYFVLALGAVIDELETTITEYVIRDLVAHNFGPDEPYPVLKFEEVTAEGTPTAEALKALADAGILTPDDDLEIEVRRRYGLPRWIPTPGSDRGGPVEVLPDDGIPGEPGDEDLEPVEDTPEEVAAHDAHVAKGQAARADCPVCYRADVAAASRPRRRPTAARATPDELAERALELAGRLLDRRDRAPARQ